MLVFNYTFIFFTVLAKWNIIAETYHWFIPLYKLPSSVCLKCQTDYLKSTSSPDETVK